MAEDKLTGALPTSRPAYLTGFQAKLLTRIARLLVAYVTWQSRNKFYIYQKILNNEIEATEKLLNG